MSQETKESALTPLPIHFLRILRTFACESKQAEREQCGLVLSVSGEIAVLEMQNEAFERNRFTISPAALLDAYALHGRNIIGVYHTHWQDSTTPSDEDVQWAVPSLRYWIATVHGVWEYDMRVSPPACVHSWKYVGG